MGRAPRPSHFLALNMPAGGFGPAGTDPGAGYARPAIRSIIGASSAGAGICPETHW